MKLKKIIEGLEADQGAKKTTGEKAAFLQEIKKFNEYSSVIYRTEDLSRVGKEITELVTKAESITLQETQDWFDEITVKRNLKTLREGSKQFGQTIKEIVKLQQRLESLYEEMVIILEDTMSFRMIKLKDLIPLREAEGDEEEAGGEEAGGGNPFAAAGGDEEGGEEGGDTGGEEADAEAGGDEGGEDESGDAKDTAAPKFPIKFNKAKVKRYNNAEFISNQGELKSIDKKGIVVTVQPDNVDIFVNFSDIL